MGCMIIYISCFIHLYVTISSIYLNSSNNLTVYDFVHAKFNRFHLGQEMEAWIMFCNYLSMSYQL